MSRNKYSKHISSTIRFNFLFRIIYLDIFWLSAKLFLWKERINP